MTQKKSFLIHIDSLDILDDLTDAQCGELFKAIKSHHCDQKTNLSAIVKIAFSPFKNQFIRDDEKYQKTCERRAIAGSKGGKQKQANLANGSNCKQKVANLADNKNKSDNDNKNIKTRAVFKKPAFIEVLKYCRDRQNKVDPQEFIDHYEANGWMRGKTKIKCWKACVRTWEKNANEKTTINNRNNETPTDRSRVAANKLRRQQQTYSENSTLIQINDRPIRE